jgi:aryl-alcohol dehydrogenase-like predicted oxidoreductase
MIPGHATPEGTKTLTDRYMDLGHSLDNYRLLQGLTVSSVGIGTYLGEDDAPTSLMYSETLRLALRGGVNLVDTAINYRNQLSERIIGRVLNDLLSRKEFTRQEVVLCTKGGFIPLDGEVQEPAGEYLKEQYGTTGLIGPGEVVAGCHCLAPKFLENQLQRSLANLGVESIDVYYLHNPEMQLSEVPRGEFLKRMRLAFEWLEGAVNRGKIRQWGLATWNGLRVPAGQRDHLDLDELVALAREALGPKNHFKVLQVPYSIAMPEALLVKNQKVGGTAGFCLLEAAERAGLSIIASAALMQGKLARGLPKSFREAFPDLPSDAACALQFVRSSPGVTACLVGMRNKHHLVENMAVMKLARASDETMIGLLQK